MSKGLTEPDARDAVAMRLTLNKVRNESGKLSRQLLIDPLTGLFDRRDLDGDKNSPDTVAHTGTLQREFDEALRSRHGLSILMIDIDSFKGYNDEYGHQEGDVALRAIANIIRTSIRDTDRPFRFGGEEMLVLSPETDLKAAQIVAERLRDAIAKISTLKRQVTVSIGVSTYDENREVEFDQVARTKDELVQLADDALYFSKKEGKNRVTAGNNLTDKQISEIHPHQGE